MSILRTTSLRAQGGAISAAEWTTTTHDISTLDIAGPAYVPNLHDERLYYSKAPVRCQRGRREYVRSSEQGTLYRETERPLYITRTRERARLPCTEVSSADGIWSGQSSVVSAYINPAMAFSSAPIRFLSQLRITDPSSQAPGNCPRPLLSPSTIGFRRPPPGP